MENFIEVEVINEVGIIKVIKLNINFIAYIDITNETIQLLSRETFKVRGKSALDSILNKIK